MPHVPFWWLVLNVTLRWILLVSTFSGWTKLETVDSLARKAGYTGVITEVFRKKFRITRYQSSLYTLHYSDYVSYAETARGVVPLIAVKC